jgi:excisionase family DNA binding protein
VNKETHVRYLTVPEVAERFGVTPKTVYHLAQEGKLPGPKFGGQWRFDEARLVEWFAEQDQSTKSVEG